MDWININDKWPDKYQNVIICSDTGVVKSAMCLGNKKFATYLQVVYWMPMPEAPKFKVEEIEDKPEKKKRGRPKKGA